MIMKEGTRQVTNLTQETSKERRIAMKDLRRNVKVRKHQEFVGKIEEED